MAAVVREIWYVSASRSRLGHLLPRQKLAVGDLLAQFRRHPQGFFGALSPAGRG